MNKAELTAEEKLYKSWEGKTISYGGITINDDWSDCFDITFTDGTKFHLWIAQEALHVEKRRKQVHESANRCVCPKCGQPHDPKLVYGGQGQDNRSKIKS